MQPEGQKNDLWLSLETFPLGNPLEGLVFPAVHVSGLKRPFHASSLLPLQAEDGLACDLLVSLGRSRSGGPRQGFVPV